MTKFKIIIHIQIFILLILASTKLIGQSYSATVESQPFVFLENFETPNLIETPQEDWPVFKIPIEFDFDYFNITSDTIYSSGNSFGGYTSLNQDENDLYMLVHFLANFIDRGDSQDTILSPIRFKTEGNSPNRVFTLEYKEMGFFFGETDFFGLYLDYINIQVRLYETSGNIEFHIGPYIMNEDPEEVFDGFPGPLVGLLANVQNELGGSVGEVITVSGDVQNPTISNDPFLFMDWPIPENTLFRFSRKLSSTQNIIPFENKVVLYPNPFNDRINIQTKADIQLIEVFDLYGKKILKSSEKQLDTRHLNEGVYTFKIYDNEKVNSYKMMKLK